MNLLEEIRAKVHALPEASRPGCIEVLRHLEQCERLLAIGRKDGPEYFNDIIYRANQAFEGALKEAYGTLEGKNPDEVTLHKVEELFASNSVVRPRIVELMNNYRREWRNPSTHDYTLKFDENESILAIVSVSAFFLALLGQIADKLAIRDTQEIVKRAVENSNHGAGDFLSSVAGAIKSVLESMAGHAGYVTSGPTVQLLLAEAISGAQPDWKIEIGTRQEAQGGAVIETDLLISRGAEHIPVEIKVSKGPVSYDSRLLAVDQLMRFMRAAGLSQGVLVRLPAMYERPTVKPIIFERYIHIMPSNKTGPAAGIVEIGFALDS